MSDQAKIILTGMQPTGYLHLGHYLGVLTNLVQFQQSYNSYYMIADWHALTTFYEDYKLVKQYILGIVSDWLAAGIDPNKATIFVQSKIQEHAELHLILSMYTPTSWLIRNPTYKDKQENSSKVLDSYGFLGYPVLQAADILLYQADIVPIGEDQLPHLELTREIARRFNNFHGVILKEPQAKLSEYPKVLGLDGRKMSKSYFNTLNLNDDVTLFESKFMKMQTDPNRIKKTDIGNPKVCTVFSYYSFFAKEEEDKIVNACTTGQIGCVDCKRNILSKINANLENFRDKKDSNMRNPQLLEDIIEAGTKKAKAIASQNLNTIKNAIGIYP